MKLHNINFAVILYSHYKKPRTKYPLAFRATQGRDTKYFWLNGIEIEPKFWDKVECRVIGRQPEKEYINDRIEFYLKKAKDILIKFEAECRPCNPKIFIDAVEKEKGSDSFFDFANIYIDRTANYHTKENINKAIKKLKEYCETKNQSNLSFSMMSTKFIMEYQTWLRQFGRKNKTGCGINYTHNLLKEIRAIINAAINEDYMDISKNPFNQITLKTEATKKERLEFNEINSIENLSLEENSDVWHACNFWLFSYYCHGIRFTDFALLSKEEIHITSTGDVYLRYIMNKTKQKSKKVKNIRLLPEAIKILNYYTNVTGPFLFPLLSEIDLNDEERLKKRISSVNAKTNKNLKKVAKKAEIKTNLHFHLTRNSTADLLKQSGHSTNEIKDVLGHLKEETTQIYMSSWEDDHINDIIQKAHNKRKNKEL